MPLSATQLAELKTLEGAVSTAITNLEAADPAQIEASVVALATAQSNLTTFTATLTADTVTPPTPAPLTFSSPPAQVATVGEPWELNLLSLIGGGTEPYSVAISPAIPGVSISGTTLSGDPTTASPQFQIAVTITDKSNPVQSKTGSFELTVNATAPLIMGAVEVETWTVGQPIKPVTLTSTGGTQEDLVYTVGGLCPGLSIEGNQVVGTPTDNPAATDPSNTNSMTFTVKDSAGNTNTGALVTWTLVDSTVTPPPPPPTGTLVPTVPSNFPVPTALVKDYEFASMPSATAATGTPDFVPTWFGNSAKQNGTNMSASRVNVVNGVGVTYELGTDGVGGIMSSDPNDGQHASGKGFSLQPTAGKPVYIEADLGLPATAAGKLADWIEWWLNGQTWPENGEIDILETLSALAAAHTQWGSGSSNQGGQGAGLASQGPGRCIAGVMWTTTGVTFFYNRVQVWTHTYASAAETTAMNFPKYVILGISLPIAAGVDLAEPATLTCASIRAWQGPTSVVDAAELILDQVNSDAARDLSEAGAT